MKLEIQSLIGDFKANFREYSHKKERGFVALKTLLKISNSISGFLK